MRTFLIIVLLVAIVALGGAWLYLLLNGAPKGFDDLKGDIFGNGTVTPAPAAQAPVVPDVPVSDRTIATNVLLLKATDRAVAGASISTIGSSTVVRYMEKGTGHIYELDLTTGVERRISATTILGVVNAIWSKTGSELVYMTEVNGAPGELRLGILSDKPDSETLVFDTEKLEADPLDIAFSDDGATLYYTKRSLSGTEGFRRDLTTGKETRIFSLPLRDISILWDLWDDNGAVRFYTRPAEGFEGYLYTSSGNTLTRETSGVGLVAARMDSDTMLIYQYDQQYAYSTLIRQGDLNSPIFTLATVREKCTGDYPIWCASSPNIDATFPVSWYQGLVSYSDSIYRIDRETGDTTQALDLEFYAREQIDVTDLSEGPDGRLMFRNKRDDALWILNTSLIPAST